MKVLITILFVCVAHLVFATDHYATSAEEANKKCDEAKAGDRVIMKNGTYTNAAIRFFNINGSMDKPIIFRAETPGKVFFEGNSTLSFGGDFIQVSGFVFQNGGKELGTKSVIEIRGSYSSLEDCALIDYNNNDYAVDNKWVSIYGKYNLVTRCFLKDKRNLGATLVVWLKDGEEAHHTVSHNYFLNRYNGPDADNGLESIRIGDSKTSFTNAHCVVAFNRFENCDGEIEIISNKSCFNSYLHNTFYNNNGGLTLRHGNNCLVDGNVFDGGEKERSYGVRIIGEGHAVINNYFYNLRGAAKEPFRAPLTVVNGLENTPINGYFQVRRAVISHNIFVNNVLPNVRLGAKSSRPGMTIAPDTITISNNLFYDNAKNAGDVYEDLNESKNLTIEANKVAGYNLSAPKKGFVKAKPGRRGSFDWIKDNDGNYIASVEDKFEWKDVKAGANWIHPNVKDKLAKRKYTIVSDKEVGPNCMR